MPIYAYRCERCGHEQDVLQKLSDPALSVCPACGEATFAKRLTAPAFQLKGTGWYVTDFRDNGKPKAAGGDAPAAAAPAEGAAGKPDAADAGKASAAKAAAPEGGAAAAPAAAPAPAAPSSSPTGGSAA